MYQRKNYRHTNTLKIEKKNYFLIWEIRNVAFCATICL